jgi:tetratricopeptide (TPR) repeat protein
VSLIVVVALVGVARAQSPVPGTEAGSGGPGPLTEERVHSSPEEAWQAGDWQQALQGFLDRQVAAPEDPALMMNVGSAHYRLGDLDAAALSFAAAAAKGDDDIRSDALFDLGNVAYQQDRLDEAVEHFVSSLDADPDDMDAKHNLELVREELRRRQEEAENQEQQEPQPGQDEAEQQGQGEGQNQQEQGAPGQQPPDRDQDGLPDEVEQQGKNPTDPDSPDSDGDGLLDGEEDLDRDGELDPGETDPNNSDSDGDGTPDAREVGEGEAAEPGELSEAIAARLLDALEEGKPRRKVPVDARRTEKDW